MEFSFTRYVDDWMSCLLACGVSQFVKFNKYFELGEVGFTLSFFLAIYLPIFFSSNINLSLLKHVVMLYSFACEIKSQIKRLKKDGSNQKVMAFYKSKFFLKNTRI